jgi:hypothetical protein
MKILHQGGLAAGIFAAGLAACLLAFYLTRDAAPEKSTVQASPIDRRLLDTARQTAGLAETAREQELAGQAIRLADHELDQAYASAVREAAAAKPPTSGPLEQLNARIAKAQQQIAVDQARIAKLTKSNANGQLEVVQAQLELDQDELQDAQQDLIRQGGDEHMRLEKGAAGARRCAEVPGSAGESSTDQRGFKPGISG